MTDNPTPTVQVRILPPDTLVDGRYRIVELIGAGGMATVYRAQDVEQEDAVIALKVLHKELARDKTYLERFVREVKLMSKISQKNVCKVYDISTDANLVYFTMEYIEGESLAKLMETRSFSIPEVAKLISDVCQGLHAIHALGIVHRDLKPENILIDSSGTAKILDFGVARDQSSRLTTETQRIGSIYYMAPEIWKGERLTPSIDFYSLGVVLYELATGKIPFDQDYPGAVMKMHLEETPIAPQTINQKVPSWLNTLILRLLAKTPAERPSTAMQIAIEAEKHLRNNEPKDETSDSLPAAGITHTRTNTFVFKLTATRLLDQSDIDDSTSKPRRKATVIIPLPKNSAIVFEIEKPSRDFIYFGLFLISLQVMDGVLTSMGVGKFGVDAEGNTFLRGMMIAFGPENALLAAKAFAILLVIGLTVLAKQMRWIRDLIGVLSYIYLAAAIVPWILILWKARG